MLFVSVVMILLLKYYNTDRNKLMLAYSSGTAKSICDFVCDAARIL